MKYIQQAYKGNKQWYFWLITLVLTFIGWQVIGIIPLVVTAIFHSSGFGEFSKAAANNFTSLGINKNLFLFVLIFMFAIGLLFLFIGVRYIHKRTITSLVTSRDKIDWKRFFTGFLIWGSVACVMITIGIWLYPENYIYNFNAIPFFTLVVISFPVFTFTNKF